MSLLGRLAGKKSGTDSRQAPAVSPAFRDAQKRLLSRLADMVTQDSEEGGGRLSGDALKARVLSVLDDMLRDVTTLTPTEQELLRGSVMYEVFGFGPIQPFLDEDDVSEIMVNGPDRVFVERKGKIELSDVTFVDDEHVRRIIEKIVAPIGRRIDESSPMVDARLPDGSRVNAIIPPVSIDGPSITIRKFRKEPFSSTDLVGFGTLSEEAALFLRSAAEARYNVLVSGGTGSGKTTTLNVLSSFIPSDERVVTIEDAAELSLQQPHVVRLESRPANIEGKGAVTIRLLVRNALRMRPDRIIVGECRGEEAFDMLQAMNTGHDGSLTTLHANSPRDVLSRLESMVLMAGMDLPTRAIREQISSAVDLIVHQERLRDGTRRVVNITEITGMEGDIIQTQDLFTFHHAGFDESGRIRGTLQATGLLPARIYKFELSGVQIPKDLFRRRSGYQ